MTIQLRNDHVTVCLDETTGYWESLSFGDESESVVQPGPMFDLVFERRPMHWMRKPAVKSYDVAADGRMVRFVIERQGLRVTHTVTLAADAPRLDQAVEIECLGGTGQILTEIYYTVPGFLVGEAADCLLQAPAQKILPDTPYAKIAAQPLDGRQWEPLVPFQGWLEPAPDQASGLVAVENRQRGRVASAWLYSEKATTFPCIDGTGERVTLEFRHQLASWLKPGTVVKADGLSVLLTEGTLSEHLAQFRQAAYEGKLATAPVPDWFREARLLQIAPYPITEWTERLGEVAEMGFNLLYLCPVQDGVWYQIYDHFKIGQHVGTKEELKAFVDKAHALGMKVIFDFIPQGISAGSPLLEEFRKWFVLDAHKRPFGSHGWGNRPGAPLDDTISMDWGNPDYRRWAVDWALWYVDEFGIDGFRCDAMHWKEPNLDPDNPRPAYETVFGGIRMMEMLHEELKAKNPDAVLISEVWGPIFQRCTDASYENGWMLHKWNEAWLRGEPLIRARQFVQFLEMSELARPGGYLRTTFNANHDMKKNASLAHGNPVANALSFMHAFCDAIPFVMWGELPDREAFYASVLQARAGLSGMKGRYDSTACDADDLFVSLWDGESGRAVAVANISNAPLSTQVRLPAVAETMTPVLETEGVGCEVDGTTLSVSLPTGGYALLRY